VHCRGRTFCHLFRFLKRKALLINVSFYYFFLLLLCVVVQSFSKADYRSFYQEFPLLLWNQKCNYHVQKCLLREITRACWIYFTPFLSIYLWSILILSSHIHLSVRLIIDNAVAPLFSSQSNSVHVFTSYLFKANVNIIFQSVSSILFPSVFPVLVLQVFLTFHALYIPCQKWLFWYQLEESPISTITQHY
jgi:hypothetical protein